MKRLMRRSLVCLASLILVTGCSHHHHSRKEKAKTKWQHSHNRKEKDEPKHPIILGKHNTNNPITEAVLGS